MATHRTELQSSAEILDDYLDHLEPAERRDHLQSIRKNTRRMAGLMEEVLLLGSLDAGKMEFKPASLEIRSFLFHGAMASSSGCWDARKQLGGATPNALRYIRQSPDRHLLTLRVSKNN